MTTPKWTEMDARQRDCLVAEKVMGWRWWRIALPNKDGQSICVICDPSTSRFGEQVDVPDALQNTELAPHFTTDIAAAFQVVEKMRGEGWVCQLDNGLDSTWEVQFYRPEDQTTVQYAAADTLPECIALAALRAKGVNL